MLGQAHSGVYHAQGLRRRVRSHGSPRTPDFCHSVGGQLGFSLAEIPGMEAKSISPHRSETLVSDDSPFTGERTEDVLAVETRNSCKSKKYMVNWLGCRFFGAFQCELD